MNPNTSKPAVPSATRRFARAVRSPHPDARAVQIGVVATVALHVLLLVLAPRIERFIGADDVSSSEDWRAKEFQVEMVPSAAPAEEPVPSRPLKFVEANPAAPDNVPDKTDNVAAQNQQVAQETPTPGGKSDAPASKGDPSAASTAIVSGMQAEPRPSAARPPEPSARETPDQKQARREQLPLPGVEKFEGDNPEGAGGNIGKTAPNVSAVPERVEGSPDSVNDTGERVGLYYKVDPKKPKARPTLAPNVVKARPTPLANREFGTENIGAAAYDAKWSAYGEYMQKFLESVDVQWQRIIQQSNVYPVAGTKVVVVFRMDEKGDIPQIVDVRGGGGRAAQDACVSAIVARAPYGAWTDDMIAVLGRSQEITFTFHYN